MLNSPEGIFITTRSTGPGLACVASRLYMMAMPVNSDRYMQPI